MRYIISGQTQLKGEVSVSGDYLSSVVLASAALLSDLPIELFNYPGSEAFKNFADVLGALGVSISYSNNGSVVLNAKDIHSHKVARNSFGALNFLLVPALMSRFGNAVVQKVSGIEAEEAINRLKACGVAVKEAGDYFEFAGNASLGDVTLREDSLLSSVVSLLLLVLLDGKRVLSNIPEDPVFLELITFLNRMGAKIEPIDTPQKSLEITGVRSFSGGSYTIMPNRSEAAFFSAIAIISGGDVLLNNIDPSQLTSFQIKLDSIGALYDVLGPSKMRVWGGNLFSCPSEVDVKEGSPFTLLWQSLFLMILLTKSVGPSVVHLPESYDFHLFKELNRMGAKIAFEDFSFRVACPVVLKSSRVAAKDFVSGLSLIAASLSGKGKVELHTAEKVDVYMDNLVLKLDSLGIEVVRE